VKFLECLDQDNQEVYIPTDKIMSIGRTLHKHQEMKFKTWVQVDNLIVYREEDIETTKKELENI